MSDRTGRTVKTSDTRSAEIFGQIFNFLAKKPLQNKDDAAKFWRRTQSYDFHPCQMECNDSLVSLGLARWVNDEIDYGPK